MSLGLKMGSLGMWLYTGCLVALVQMSRAC